MPDAHDPAPAPGTPRIAPGRLLMPALRWDGSAYRAEGGALDTALGLGVAGFILFGGTAAAAARITSELRDRAGRPLLFASDLERGGGQQFDGLPGLPPLAALGALDDADLRRDTVRAAARETARAARAVGVGMVFAPVADLSIEPDNPIVGTRSPGADPDRVGEVVESWVAGCLDEGVACSPKHWPGHGRTRTDSHAELPVVPADAATLTADRAPFLRGVAAGAPAVMTAHVAFPALDPSGLPATRSGAILGLLRSAGFDGAIVTDALIMEGAGAADAAVREGLAAGVDLFLYPRDVAQAAEALAAGDPDRLADAVRRVDALVDRWADPIAAPDAPSASVAARICDLALEALPRDELPRAGWLRVVTIDDDLGGPYASPSRDVLSHALLELGVPVGDAPSTVDAEARDCLVVIAVYAEPRAWKGRAGLSPRALDEVRSTVAACARRGERTRIVCFGGTRIRDDLERALGPDPSGRVLVAWGGEAPMQRAAARYLARGLRGGGTR